MKLNLSRLSKQLAKAERIILNVMTDIDKYVDKRDEDSPLWSHTEEAELLDDVIGSLTFNVVPILHSTTVKLENADG